MDLHLKGKTVVVTGGASGIGRAVAWEFAQEGCQIAICDIDQGKMDTFAEEFSKSGVEVYTQNVDVSHPQALTHFADEVGARFGKIDIWVNNAGIPSNQYILDMSPHDWEKVISINLSSVFYGTQAAARHMKKTGGGAILNTSSYTSLVPASRRAAYTASKSGINGFTRLAAGELAPHGIRVNAVLPGTIETPMQATRPRDEFENAMKKIALQRAAQPEEVAKVFVFLASDAASYITGIHLEVSGGKLCIQDPEMPWHQD